MNFSAKEISRVNEYNKLRFILNTLENLRYEMISRKDTSIDNFEILNVVFILLEKLFSENEKSDNDKKETTVLFINRKDIQIFINESNLSLDVLRNKIEKTLLDKLEKELKSIIDQKNKLCEALKIGKSEIYTEKLSIRSGNRDEDFEILYKNYENVYNILNDVFDMINDIFEYQKIQLIDKENGKIEDLINYQKKLLQNFES